MWSEDFVDVETEEIKKAVISPSESLLRAWCVIFINEYNQEQDRMFLLTDLAYYRVKFNYKEKKVQRYQRIALVDVTGIQKGLLKPQESDPTRALYYGFRIFAKEPTDDPNSVSIVYRTFRPLEETKDHVNHIVKNLADATKKCHLTNPGGSLISSNSGELVEEVDFVYLDATPIFSKAHNALGLGRSRKKASQQKSVVIDTKQPLSQSGPVQLPGSNQIHRRSTSVSNTQFIPHSKSPTDNSAMSTSAPLFSDPLSLLLKGNNEEDIEYDDDPSPPPRTLSFVVFPKAKSNAGPKPDPKPSFQDPLSINNMDGNISAPLPPIESLLSAHASSNMKRAASVGSDLDQKSTTGMHKTSSVGSDMSTEPKETEGQVAETQDPLKRSGDTIPVQKSFTSQANYLLTLFVEMDKLGHMLSAIVFAFFVGYCNFSFLWVLGVLYLVYKIELSRQERAYRFKKREKKREEQMQGVAKKWVKSKPTLAENCNWFNIMITELWPYMSLSIAETSKAKLKELLEYSLNQKKPTAVENVSVSEINFGGIPPSIKSLSAVKPPFPDFRVDFDIAYNGPAQIILDVHLGGKYVNVKVPIAINEFDIKGRMRVEMTFCSKSPFLHTLSYAFIHPPSIGLSIKPLKAIDIMDIPFMKESIEESLKHLISTTLVLPEQIVIPYFMWYAKDPSITTEQTKQEDIERHALAVEKSIRDGEYAGLLHVRVLEGRKLIDKIGQNSLPYCIITSGQEVYTSSAVKRSKNPVWNEFFELLVNTDQERKVEVTVMARDSINGDDFLGMAIIDFSDFGKETKDMWVKLETTNKRGASLIAGEIHIQLRYVPAPSAEEALKL